MSYSSWVHSLTELCIIKHTDGHMAALLATKVKGTSYGCMCSKPLYSLSIATASAKMSQMISAVNMIINYTCVRTNGLGQHKRTSMLNWTARGIIRKHYFPWILERIKQQGLRETGIVFVLPRVISGSNYYTIIKELKLALTVIATWIQVPGGVCLRGGASCVCAYVW